MTFGPSAFAYAINDGGVITGTRQVGLTSRAFTWSAGGSPTDLPSLGGNTSEGNGINNQGDVVGDSFRGALLDEIAVYWPASGTPVDLGTLGGLTSSARDINNHRQIVGYARNAAGASRAFLSEAGAAMVDLNTLLPADSGWVLLSANAINDAGQIAGEGIFDGDVRAFLLTPAVTADTTPPVVSSVTTTPDSIWPPKHQMVDVSVRVAASDDSGETPVCGAIGVQSSEPDNGEGDGDTSSDTEVVGPGHVRVRAERSGPVGARVYTVTVQCTDGSGNAATGDGTVTIGDDRPGEGFAEGEEVGGRRGSPGHERMARAPVLLSRRPSAASAPRQASASATVRASSSELRPPASSRLGCRACLGDPCRHRQSARARRSPAASRPSSGP